MTNEDEWIEHENHIECNKCHVWFLKDHLIRKSFCPNCGVQNLGYVEKPFITECRNAAIEKNMPLYFVYYEETGIFEVYITATKELFEKRHCSKHLLNFEFEKIATKYLDAYTDWEAEQ